ncbi:MAG: cytochrome c-type biogenesis protein [Alphaproteobacteria bacterium]|nr:cytochrome c-type biogenesis protein [Alphaproteobacteria bacterium]
MRFLALLMCSLLLPIAAHALTVDTPLPDSAQEARAKALFRDIRCVVCQSEPLADSPSEMAKTMRAAIREQIASGMSDDEVKAFLVSRYGDFILMQPPFKSSTLLLWLGPLLIFIAALLGVVRFFRRQSA